MPPDSLQVCSSARWLHVKYSSRRQRLQDAKQPAEKGELPSVHFISYHSANALAAPGAYMGHSIRVHHSAASPRTVVPSTTSAVPTELAGAELCAGEPKHTFHPDLSPKDHMSWAGYFPFLGLQFLGCKVRNWN